MNIKAMTWQEIHQALQATDLLIYPLGANETYGPHLPTGLETYVGDWMGSRLGERANGLVMPTLPISCSRVNDVFPGNLFVSPELLRDYLLETTRGLTRFGIKQVFYLNIHGPNLYPIESAVQTLAGEGVRACQTDFWRFMIRRCRDLLSDDEHATNHASEMATSIMLYLDESLVRQDRYTVTRPKLGLAAEYVVPDVNFHTPFSEISPTGHLGDPSKASAEKGQALLERSLDALAELLAAWRT